MNEQRRTGPASAKRPFDPRWLVVTATAMFAFKGIFAVLAYRNGMSVLSVLVWRIAIATPFFWLGAALLGRRNRARWDRKAAFYAGLTGLAFFVAAASDFFAIQRIGAGASRVILFSFPAFVLGLESLLGRHELRLRDLAVLLGAWVGIALVALPHGFGDFLRHEWSGALFALTSALSYSIFLVAGQRQLAILGSLRFTASAQTGAALGLTLVYPFIAAQAPLSLASPGLGWVTLMALLATVIPTFLMFEGMRSTGAAKASLLAFVGPVITVTAAWIVLGERFTLLQGVGALLVVAAVATHQLGRGAGQQAQQSPLPARRSTPATESPALSPIGPPAGPAEAR